MSNTPPDRPKPNRLSPALIGGGVLVAALGFGLPALFTDSTPEPGHAPAAASAGQSAPLPMPAPAATGIGMSLLKLVVGLIVVSGLCVVVARLAGQKPPAVSGAMHVLASIAVGPCVLHLVRAGGRRLLIGTDAGGVKSVLELPGPDPDLASEPEPAAEPLAAAPTDDTISMATPVPSPAAPPSREEILNLLLRLRARPTPSPPA